MNEALRLIPSCLEKALFFPLKALCSSYLPNEFLSRTRNVLKTVNLTVFYEPSHRSVPSAGHSSTSSHAARVTKIMIRRKSMCTLVLFFKK